MKDISAKKMGIQKELFIDDRIPNPLICSICDDVMDNPVGAPCGHCFCEGCIHNWLQTNRRCPVDKTAVMTAKKFNPIMSLRNMISSLEVKCPNGCGWSGCLSLLESHENNCSSSHRVDGDDNRSEM